MFSAVASHPQVRRKLDDVAHKLNILYDKLRAQVLSPATLQGLHTILQHIWQYDYQACMQVISGLIAGGSFAEMSDFMPGVKVLLQLAQQQGVYVEYQK
jgi:protein transport protein SEC31